MSTFEYFELDFNSKFTEREIDEVRKCKIFDTVQDFRKLVTNFYNTKLGYKIKGDRIYFEDFDVLTSMFGSVEQSKKVNAYDAVNNKITQLDVFLTLAKLNSKKSEPINKFWSRSYYERVLYVLSSIKDMLYQYVNIYQKLEVRQGTGFNKEVSKRAKKETIKKLDFVFNNFCTDFYRNGFTHKENLFTNSKNKVEIENHSMWILKGEDPTINDVQVLEEDINKDINLLYDTYKSVLKELK